MCDRMACGVAGQGSSEEHVGGARGRLSLARAVGVGRSLGVSIVGESDGGGGGVGVLDSGVGGARVGPTVLTFA